MTNRFLQLNIFSLREELLKCWIWCTITLWFLYFFHEIKTNADRDETKETIMGNIINLQMKSDELEFYECFLYNF